MAGNLRMRQRKGGRKLSECEGQVRVPFPDENGQLVWCLKACMSFHSLHNNVPHM